ncbi:MAG: YciI family protein [Rickettsiales bacterium]
MSKLFLVILKYIAPLEEIDKYRSEHLKYLEQYYQENIFIASGPQIPRFGGVIMARVENRKKLYKIIAKDPFNKNLCAEYQIHEFEVTNSIPAFQYFLETINIKKENINAR